MIEGHRKHSRVHLDRQWKVIWKDEDVVKTEIPKPHFFNEMERVSSIISKDFPVVRIDFNEVNDDIKITELTFTPASGFWKYYVRDQNLIKNWELGLTWRCLMKKTINNFMYQSIFQLVKIILPLITIPIVSNALGPDGIGTYNYTNSIAQYFVLIAGLGVGVYGNREIAIVRENKEKLSQRFWELFCMSFIISLFSLVAYLLIVSFSEDRIYFYLQSLIVVAAVFDISWFFMGIEDFKKISLSSLFSQIITFLGIVIFVKEANDLWIYILLQSMSILIAQVITWIFIFDKINIKKIALQDIFKHLYPSLQYFIPKIAIILYTNMNKTLLGWLDSKNSVGYYANTLIINGVLVTLVTTLDLVLLPKFSNLVSKGKNEDIVKAMKKTINIQLFLLFL